MTLHVCVVPVLGVRITHPHYRRGAAGHGHRALLQCFGAGQCSGCHALLLSAEHFLQKGEIFSLCVLNLSFAYSKPREVIYLN